MKDRNLENKHYLKFILIYGILINLICFICTTALENTFLNRTFVLTPVVYSILLSVIISKLHDGSFSFFLRSLFYLILLIIGVLLVYFLSWKVENEILSYFLIGITYVFFISIILKEISFVKLNMVFFLHQIVIFLLTIFLTFSLLNDFQGHDFGIQFLFLIWVLLLNGDLVLLKKNYNF